MNENTGSVHMFATVFVAWSPQSKLHGPLLALLSFLDFFRVGWLNP